MRKLSYLFICLVIISCSSGNSEEKDPVFNEEGIALAGYDPVAYFEQSEAKLGTKSESVNYQGLDYYFSSTKKMSKRNLTDMQIVLFQLKSVSPALRISGIRGIIGDYPIQT